MGRSFSWTVSIALLQIEVELKGKSEVVHLLFVILRDIASKDVSPRAQCRLTVPRNLENGDICYARYNIWHGVKFDNYYHGS